jgi:hypothetical protein
VPIAKKQTIPIGLSNYSSWLLSPAAPFDELFVRPQLKKMPDPEKWEKKTDSTVRK